ncbi:hypothetical protein RhiXN_00747 [Rhizoctonia solani]|uniref:BZIP domain-containing protein n=1 Tax=Rhizoctonia solani TaxID=456999 RepID=A0A8H8NVV5_9AGAM|nr:uncharacterized protein RhiXN_00747 [Rhizoctonia solani]QRW19341.1 hypothetical protein RhiXN_00747 [Rhizoctonia solani]
MSTPVDNKADDLSPTELATLRRKKNADAQAAFRSRRANYIANLEETVTRLEFVVRQLQNNCREARDMLEETKQENMELRATINSMRQAERERERVWRALNNRGNPQATLSDASSDTDGSLVTANCQQQLGMVQMDNSLIDYQGRGLTYPQPGELSVHQLPSPADTMNALPSYDAYANQNIMLSGANYPLFNDNHHDGSAQWNASMGGGNAYSSMDDDYHPELGDENQMERNTMVRFHNSPGALTTFDPSVVNMRHPSTPASASDHGASEEIESMDPQTPRRLTRSRSHLRRQSGSDPYPTPSTGGSSESRRERRRARDDSPDGPAFSDTLAVIKAQAFGTARKTRTRANRGVSEHAARVAMEVLEARGLSLGVSLDGAVDRRRRRSTRGVADED